MITFLSMGLFGCSALPINGPTNLSVLNGADSRSESDVAVTVPYVMIDIDPKVLASMREPASASLSASFGVGKGLPPVTKIGTGDVIQVTIFESSAGGLFIPTDAGSRPGNFVQLPQQAVDSSGSVTIPYAGKVVVTGKSIGEIERDIEGRLTNRAIEPKVVVNLVSQQATTLTVIGDVKSPNRIQISPGGDRIMDALAKAGGILSPGYETSVTLLRKGKSATVMFPALLSSSKENVYMQPDDTVYVEKKPQTFIALGATGLIRSTASSVNSLFNFESSSLLLVDAVARAGGLSDSRADAKQVYLYRYEDRHVLESIGANLSKIDPNADRIATIYRADFSDPSSFFAAEKFPMRDRDLLYVANASAVDYLKFLAVLNQTVTNYSEFRAAKRLF